MTLFEVGEILYRKDTASRSLGEAAETRKARTFDRWPTFIRMTKPCCDGYGQFEGVAMKVAGFVSSNSTKVYVTLDEARIALFPDGRFSHRAMNVWPKQVLMGRNVDADGISTKIYYRKWTPEDWCVANTDMIPDREINLLQMATIKEAFEKLPFFPSDLVNEISEFCLN